ncbi:MAG: hypothetical protein HY744_22935 [Deltaproteobacteria bacterium]|nr:hypothetical protein [Deltaproteobacteria bacterium]
MSTRQAGPAALAAAALAFLAAAGCGEPAKKPMDPKQACELVAAEAREPVALIAGYRAYLEEPKPQPYLPKRRTDLEEAAFFAAEEIRHAANTARQYAARTLSPVAAVVSPPLLEVAVRCAEIREMGAVAKCRKAARDLEPALQQQARKCAAAGLGAPFPLAEPGAITDKARAQLARLENALGPGPAEKAMLAKLPDAKVSEDDLVAACAAATAEADTVRRELDKAGPEELHRVAAVHQQALGAHCNRVGLAAGAHNGVLACRKKPTSKKDPRYTECKIECAKAMRILDEGVPAEAFSAMAKDHEEICKSEDE